MVDCSDSTANMWLQIIRIFKRKHPLDKSREAKLALETAYAECVEVEDKIVSELNEIALEIKQSHTRNLTSKTKQLLLSSRSKRKALQNMQNHKMHLQRQQETLQSCELNEKVISSMKQTSGILKDIGLDDKLAQVDDAMYDVRESMETANQITSALGTTEYDNDDDLLSAELAAIMDDTYLDAPVEISKKVVNDPAKSKNSMEEYEKREEPQSVSVEQAQDKQEIETEGESKSSENAIVV